MQVFDLQAVGPEFTYPWPGGEEHFSHWVDYRTAAPDGNHHVRIGLCVMEAYGRPRKRVVVWIDDHPHAQFLGADDFERTGDVLSEIRVPGDSGERICRYPDEVIPERYSGLPTVGLPTRVSGPGVHQAWAVVASIADHRVMIALAALRRLERSR
jgi:hypothetical protein